ncbi:HTH domain-containing protein [Ureibacillus sp. Re31]|uniref:HTH domain-containing protein n=1 Tax=Ureibacillus galli TaxID=2762222 RepID=A0ABR8X7K1_9BACL|nr:HTH domain-containing protein [Ureibacillus galli]MBD8025162.1 HTH domain-containing protein [Ureibacillus galli]
MYNVCAFSTKYSYRWLKKCETIQIDNINLQIFFYENLTELEEAFLEKVKTFDGIIFSGQIPYLHIQRNHPEHFSKVPCAYFDISERDFYFKIAEIQYKYPDFSFKHCIIDFLYKENNYLRLKEILSPEDFPYLLGDTVEVFGHPNAYDVVYEAHSKLWEEQKVRFSLTRLTNLHSFFEDQNINLILVTPTLESMKSTILELLKEIEVADLMNSQVVAGFLEFSMSQNDPTEIEYRQIALYKAILDFNRKLGISLITYRSAIHYELITNYKDFLFITNNQEMCSLVEFLRNQLSFKVKIGWGIGKTLQEARIQAEKAATYCTGSLTEAYILTKENQLIGPLDGNATVAMNDLDNDKLEKIAEDTNISLLHLQKIYGLVYKLKREAITAEDLSIHLSVSIRTANRLLKRLEETNYATSVTNKVTKAKGRPSKIYHFNF